MPSLLEFRVDSLRLALDLDGVERVFPMVSIRALPQGPECALGVVNVHGAIVPVVDVRTRLECPRRPFGLDGRLVVAQTSRRRLALAVDVVDGVRAVDTAAVKAPETILPGIRRLRGIVALPDGLLLIQDLDALLSLDEERDLDRALEPGAAE